jgi:hypothetical protein
MITFYNTLIINLMYQGADGKAPRAFKATDQFEVHVDYAPEPVVGIDVIPTKIHRRVEMIRGIPLELTRSIHSVLITTPEVGEFIAANREHWQGAVVSVDPDTMTQIPNEFTTARTYMFTRFILHKDSYDSPLVRQLE